MIKFHSVLIIARCLWFHSVQFFASYTDEGKDLLGFRNFLDSSKIFYSFASSFEFKMITFVFLASILLRLCVSQANWEIPEWQKEFEFEQDHIMSETTRPDRENKVTSISTTRPTNRPTNRPTHRPTHRPTNRPPYKTSTRPTKNICSSIFPSIQSTQKDGAKSNGPVTIPSTGAAINRVSENDIFSFRIPCKQFKAISFILCTPDFSPAGPFVHQCFNYISYSLHAISNHFYSLHILFITIPVLQDSALIYLCLLISAILIFLCITHKRKYVLYRGKSIKNFLVACTQLFQLLSPSVGLSVCLSVCRFVYLSLKAPSTRLNAMGLLFITFNLAYIFLP